MPPNTAATIALTTVMMVIGSIFTTVWAFWSPSSEVRFLGRGMMIQLVVLRNVRCNTQSKGGRCFCICETYVPLGNAKDLLVLHCIRLDATSGNVTWVKPVNHQYSLKYLNTCHASAK